MPSKGLTTGRHRTDGSTEARTLCQAVHLGRQPSGPPRVAVAQEEDLLARPGLSLLALCREGQSLGLDLTSRTLPSGGVALV